MQPDASPQAAAASYWSPLPSLTSQPDSREEASFWRDPTRRLEQIGAEKAEEEQMEQMEQMRQRNLPQCFKDTDTDTDTDYLQLQYSKIVWIYLFLSFKTVDPPKIWEIYANSKSGTSGKAPCMLDLEHLKHLGFKDLRLF